MGRAHILVFIIWHLMFLLAPPRSQSFFAAAAAGGGKWDLLVPNIGIVAMHMQLMHNDRVVIFDRTDYGLSKLPLPNGKCRRDPNDVAVDVDCTAHSAEYDVATNTVRPLMVQTDVWCSSGSVMADGTLIQTGGWNDGDHVVRIFKPCHDKTCDWEERRDGLIQRRWYATNHILPDGRQIIIGGRGAFNYEFYPKDGTNLYKLPFLAQTNDPKAENNLYPFVFLNVDGNLFIFANNRAILFDYNKNNVVRTYPEIPDGAPRSYPSTGSAVLLPLKNLKGADTSAEVLVCGGAPKGAYQMAENGKFVGALNTCGRITITDPNPKWVMETMPLARVMGDMVILPNGEILIINGGAAGTAGYQGGRDPVRSPVLYKPDNRDGSRFEVQNPSDIPRMYHSSAILLRDGRVLVGGSNPQVVYKFNGALFPTELRLESFSPSYLDPAVRNLRPHIITPAANSNFGYGKKVTIEFVVLGTFNKDLVTATMVAPSFATHSFSQNQRLLVIGEGNVKIVGNNRYQIDVMTPDSRNLAPSGYYMLFVVHQGFPSLGVWVHMG